MVDPRQALTLSGVQKSRRGRQSNAIKQCDTNEQAVNVVQDLGRKSVSRDYSAFRSLHRLAAYLL